MLANLTRETLQDRLERFVRLAPGSHPSGLPPEAWDRLFRYWEALRLWSARIALVSRDLGGDALEVLFGESLLARPLVRPGQHLVDIGSGAGLPGLVLAAAEPGLEVTLVEPIQKKSLFLRSVVRELALSTRVIDARVPDVLQAVPVDSVDWFTLRALRLDAGLLDRLVPHLTPTGGVLQWVGSQAPDLPPSLRVEGEVEIPRRRQSRILILSPRNPC